MERFSSQLSVLLFFYFLLFFIPTESEYDYLYIGKNVNYAAARRLCGSHKDGPMTLAMPKTEEEVNAVKKYLNEVAADKSVWIGLNDEEKEGEFRVIEKCGSHHVPCSRTYPT